MKDSNYSIQEIAQILSLIFRLRLSTLILSYNYADQGPCKDKGLSSCIVNINFQNCSCFIGFIPSNKSHRCECNLDPQLKGYVTVHNASSFIRIHNSWINYTNRNRNISSTPTALTITVFHHHLQ